MNPFKQDYSEHIQDLNKAYVRGFDEGGAMGWYGTAVVVLCTVSLACVAAILEYMARLRAL